MKLTENILKDSVKDAWKKILALEKLINVHQSIQCLYPRTFDGLLDDALLGDVFSTTAAAVSFCSADCQRLTFVSSLARKQLLLRTCVVEPSSSSSKDSSVDEIEISMEDESSVAMSRSWSSSSVPLSSTWVAFVEKR